jgi:hypothetical protein
VGRNTAVLDNAVVLSGKGKAAVLGNDVTVCPGALVHGATIGDGAMVGMGAQVLPGASVGADSFIDAGAVVAAGTAVGSGQLWTGAPARRLRDLTAEEMSYLRSTAVTNATLGQRHFEQGQLSVAAVEAQEETRLTRLEGGHAADVRETGPDADVVEYYKLTTAPADSGLLRDTEIDVAAERAAREEAERAADAAEEGYHNEQARLRRIGEAVKALAAARPDRPAARDKVIADLAARDPEGAAQLHALIAHAGGVAAKGDGGGKEDVMRALAGVDFDGSYATAAEAKAAADATFARLAAHAKGLPALGAAPGSLPLPGMAAGGAAAGAQLR